MKQLTEAVLEAEIESHISEQLEQKILSLYALGNSYSQISEHIDEMYCVEFSKATISSITDKIIPLRIL